MTEKGNSLKETRRRNRVLIKKMIYRTDHATRTGIAESLGLTLPTITTTINEMLGEGILEELPLSDRLMTNATGRRPNEIAFRADAACAIGVELGPYETRGILINLRGEILKSNVRAAAAENYAGMLEHLVHLIQELMTAADRSRLLGVGIGLPGFIDERQGIIRSNPRKDWTGKPLAHDLEQRLDVPVFINNNVRLRAVRHEMNIRGTAPDTFAYLFVSKGVACPLMIRDDVLSGYTAGAGELGQSILMVGPTDPPEDRPKTQTLNRMNTTYTAPEKNENNMTCQTGVLSEFSNSLPEGGPAAGRILKTIDDLASERAVFERCQDAMLHGRLPGLKERLTQRGHLTMEDILAEEDSGDAELAHIFDDTMEYLGIALSNVVNLINPDYVVVDAYMLRSERNREKLLKASYCHFYGLNEEEVRIYIQDFDPLCGAKGAACNVIRTEFLEM